MDSTSVGKSAMSPELYGLIGPFTKIARSMSKRYDIEIVPTGTGAATDGERIYIPFTADFLPEEAQIALNGKLDHEIAHVVEEREAKEAGRETPIQILGKEKNRTIRMLTNCYEDIRIERKAGERYPGVRENLESNRHFNLAAMRANPERWSKFWHRLGCAIIIDTAGKGELDWLDDDTRAYFDAVSELVEEARVRVRSAAHAHDLATRTYNLVKKLREEADEPPPTPPPPRGGGSEEGGMGEEGEGHAVEEEGEDEGEGHSGGSEDEDEGEGGGDEGEGDETKTMPKIDLGESDVDDLGAAGSEELEKLVREDAKDNKRYIPYPGNKDRDEVVVAPNTPPEDDYDRMAAARAKLVGASAPKKLSGVEECLAIEAELGPVIGALRTKLLIITQSRARKTIQTGLESGQLDDGMLADVRTGNNLIFQELVDGVHLNTAVMNLVDLSGSMGFRQDSNDAAYYAQRSSLALAKSYDMLNIPNAFLGWHNKASRSVKTGIDPVYVCRSPFEFIWFKKFNERFRAARGRFASIYGREQNADGEALWYAAMQLLARPEKRKILMVTSDGDPLDACDYTKLGTNLFDTVARIVKLGVEVVGIGAGTDAPKQFYNEKNGAEFLFVQDFTRLPNDVFQLFYKKMTGARR